MVIRSGSYPCVHPDDTVCTNTCCVQLDNDMYCIFPLSYICQTCVNTARKTSYYLLHRKPRLDMTASRRITTAQLNFFLPHCFSHLCFLMDPHLSPGNWQAHSLDSPPTYLKPRVKFRRRGILFLLAVFVNIKALVTYSNSIRGQQERKKKTQQHPTMIDDVKQTQNKHAGKQKTEICWVVWWFICLTATANNDGTKSKTNTRQYSQQYEEKHLHPFTFLFISAVLIDVVVVVIQDFLCVRYV